MTASLSLNRDLSIRMQVPRTVLVRFPHGAALGEPHAANQQLTILRDLLWAAQDLREPGQVLEPGYRWRRSEYPPVSFDSFAR